ncbi:MULTISPECIES: hypothetical protein [Bacillus cereus group]|jgi:hypothetical protein|uniref:hypothetical protein n=1 Tax=Bacillus cereus group TaxID=86661 RepID=UPI0018A76AFC|nr:MULTISPECIES: hypothetical protein [Bacillus cereus group]MBF8118149.1 hypothetical protein [Bacillus cereus]
MKGKIYNDETGKWIAGAAAQQHIIRKNGGWEAHHEKFANRVTKIVLEEMESEYRKPKLRIVK